MKKILPAGTNMTRYRIEKRMAITQLNRQKQFNLRLKRHEKTIAIYWQLDASLNICEENLEPMLKIESDLGLKFLKEAKGRIHMPRCYF